MKINPIILWVLFFVLIGGLLYWITSAFSTEALSLKDWISIFGGYASVYGLIVILIQFQSVRDITNKTQEEISKITSVTEWSRFAEMASNVKNDIRFDQYELVGYKLHHLKQALLSIPISIIEDDVDLKKCRQDYVKSINAHISSIDSFCLDNQNNVSKEKMMKDMENVSDFFRKLVNVKMR